MRRLAPRPALLALSLALPIAACGAGAKSPVAAPVKVQATVTSTGSPATSPSPTVTVYPLDLTPAGNSPALVRFSKATLSAALAWAQAFETRCLNDTALLTTASHDSASQYASLTQDMTPQLAALVVKLIAGQATGNETDRADLMALVETAAPIGKDAGASTADNTASNFRIGNVPGQDSPLINPQVTMNRGVTVATNNASGQPDIQVTGQATFSYYGQLLANTLGSTSGTKGTGNGKRTFTFGLIQGPDNAHPFLLASYHGTYAFPTFTPAKG